MSFSIAAFTISLFMCLASRYLIGHYRLKRKPHLAGSWVVVYMGSLIAMVVSLVVAIV